MLKPFFLWMRKKDVHAINFDGKNCMWQVAKKKIYGIFRCKEGHINIFLFFFVFKCLKPRDSLSLSLIIHPARLQSSEFFSKWTHHFAHAIWTRKEKYVAYVKVSSIGGILLRFFCGALLATWYLVFLLGMAEWCCFTKFTIYFF